MMKILVPIAVLLAAPASVASPAEPASRPAPTLSLEQQTSLRCSVGFALIHRLQVESSPNGAKYPQIGAREREFFVQTAARIMDETGADRAAIADMVAAQTRYFEADSARLEAILPACLDLVALSGL